ncbi:MULTISPECIES: response regulator transcription factor [Paenibacillus]|uniref:Response regulator transcription factor n=1 Tax=Paenibacillus baimaensis TaxID=2982185 RepID=A0ABT2U8J4_9BACL|nr:MULTISPECIES: response regulator transcription factor [unclassified Paenibacillus]MCU6790952.1 response regulator transcription factor [Paenibacillus sp. WQ 127069]OMF20901.1 DNA-binding response regulator [Paenibacillus sp. FSL H7-0331]
MSVTILVADDDRDIRDVIHIYLRNEGYQVLEAENGSQALTMVQQHKIDLIILDVMMPLLDGITACLKIREVSHVPIIMLSAKEEYLDKITGLSTGADDYVTKPFNSLELIARVKAQLRRQNFTVHPQAQSSSEIVIDELVISKDHHRTTVRGQVISLTPIEFSILELLATHQGQVFSIDKIYQSVWKEQNEFYSENTVMVHIRNIREKIEINAREPQYIKTVWGVGYKIDK